MESNRIWVAVGVILNPSGEVFICRRPPDKHQGDKWEFPGGKVEVGEEFHDALARELTEEIGIKPLRVEPFLEVQFDYPDKQVLLDAWLVTRYSGEPHGKEGQESLWCPVSKLDIRHFPEANRAFIEKLQQG